MITIIQANYNLYFLWYLFNGASALRDERSEILCKMSSAAI